MPKTAADLQISVGDLATVCDRHRVPTPPRGYWAKIEAGKKVKRTLFVEVNDPALDRIYIGENGDQSLASVPKFLGRPKAERSGRRTAERIVSVAKIEGPLQKPAASIHPAIRPTAIVLRSRSAQINDVAKAVGDGFCGIEVGVQSVERVIVGLDALAHALAERGLHIEATGKQMRIVRGKEVVEFSMKEVIRRVPHEPTEAELAEEARRQKRRERYWRSEIQWDSSLYGKCYPEVDTLRTGQLMLQIEGYGGGLRRTWADGKTQTIESLIPSIIKGLETMIVSRKADRERQEDRERSWREYCRRRDMAKARGKREADRHAFVESIFETQRKIIQLETWLATSRPIAEVQPHSAYRRMVEWIQARLDALISSIEPAGIEEQLAANKLFPNLEADELYDPMGDPGERSYWHFE